MICDRCAIAADLTTVARHEKFDAEIVIPLAASSQDKAHVETKEAVRAVAHLYHGLCEGGTHCDCQHNIVLP